MGVEEKKNLEDILDTAWQFAASGFLVGVMAYAYRPMQVFSSLLPVPGVEDCGVRVLFEANLN